MHQTEFLTNKGLYKYTVMVFRLCNIPETFQRLMNLIFADFIYEFKIIYLDDILEYYEIY